MSPCWEYFKKEDDKAICNLCELHVNCIGGNTSTMKKHLQRRHDILISTATTTRSSSPSSSESQSASCSSSKRAKTTSTSSQPKLQSFLACNSVKKTQLTEKIAKMIYKDLQPFSIVEDDGFRDLMRTAEPRYVIPSRKSFRYSIIPALYNQVKTELASIK